MTDQLDLLKQLQTVDAELFRLRRQRAEKPLELRRIEQEVSTQAARLKAAEDKHKALQLAQKDKEVELQTHEASARKLQGQLLQVKTNKEYSAMQREIESLKADNSLLEEAILKTFDAVDQTMKERQAEQQRFAQEQERLKSERQRIEKDMAVIADQIGKLERTRQSVTPGVLPETLQIYDRVLKIRDGVALVPLLKDACGGCHRRLPPQVLNEVLLKAKLVTCESCNRILYFDDAQSKL